MIGTIEKTSEIGSSRLNLKLSTPAKGVYRGIEAATYHSWQGASNSRLLDLGQSPAHARYRMDNPDDPTPSLVLGDAVHVLTLEDEEEFAARFAIASRCHATKKDGNRCNNSGLCIVDGEWLCGVHLKADRYDALIAQAVAMATDAGFVSRHNSDDESMYLVHPNGRQVRISNHAPNARTLAWMTRCGVESIRVDLPPYGTDDGRRVIDQSTYDTARRMRDSFMAHPAARELYQDRADTELSIIWTDEPTGVQCKARLDLPTKSKKLVDLKTTRDASPEKFARSLFEFGYDQQGTHYVRGAVDVGMWFDSFTIACIENEPPYAVAVYEIDDEDLRAGVRRLDARLELWAKCQKSGIWPGYSDEIQPLRLKDWDRKKLERM